MPHQTLDSITPSLAHDDLRAAVARWDYEGGAGVTGPQEGYRRNGPAVVQGPRARPSERTETSNSDDRLDRLVRLLLAASAIHDPVSSTKASAAAAAPSGATSDDASQEPIDRLSALLNRPGQRRTRIVDFPKRRSVTS